MFFLLFRKGSARRTMHSRTKQDTETRREKKTVDFPRRKRMNSKRWFTGEARSNRLLHLALQSGPVGNQQLLSGTSSDDHLALRGDKSKKKIIEPGGWRLEGK